MSRMPATSGCTIRCTANRRPGKTYGPSPARTRRIGSPSHTEESPVAVRSLLSSDIPCPPIKCPSSVAKMPRVACPTAKSLHRPSKVGSVQVNCGHRAQFIQCQFDGCPIPLDALRCIVARTLPRPFLVLIVGKVLVVLFAQDLLSVPDGPQGFGVTGALAFAGFRNGDEKTRNR